MIVYPEWEIAPHPVPGQESTAPPPPSPGAIRLVQACDYREVLIGLDREQGCGCDDSRACFAGKGRVSTSDCLACVSSVG